MTIPVSFFVPRENVDYGRRAASADVVRKAYLSTPNLSFTALPPELFDRLDSLSDAGRTHGVSFGFQSARGVDRDSPVELCLARLGYLAALPEGAEEIGRASCRERV